jgi:hypothetical protein
VSHSLEACDYLVCSYCSGKCIHAAQAKSVMFEPSSSQRLWFACLAWKKCGWPCCDSLEKYAVSECQTYASCLSFLLPPCSRFMSAAAPVPWILLLPKLCVHQKMGGN